MRASRSAVQCTGVAALTLILAGAAEAAAPVASAPRPRTVAVSDTYYGVAVQDPYRWLEDASSPEVKAWSDAQNARTRAYLDALPGRGAVRAELMRLTKATSPSFYGLEAEGGLIFAYYNDPAV